MLVVDPHHWLTHDGHLPEDNPKLRNQILRVAQFIEAAGPLPPMHARETLIPCKRRPSGKPCLGLMWVLKTPDHRIHSYCQTCREDEALISNWQDTLWAEGPMEPVAIDEIIGDRSRDPNWN
jgi:hypothetical protein